jgi:hypothetical protein
VVRDVVNQVGGFFRPAVPDSDALQTSALSKEIFRFVGEGP